MQVLQLALRVVHIVAGGVWGGSVAFMFVFLVPTTRALGPQAAPVMAHLNSELRVTRVVLTSGILTVVAGVLLYWRSSSGLDADWITTPTGLAFTVGGIAGIAGLAI